MTHETALEQAFFIDAVLTAAAVCGTILLFSAQHTAAAIVLAIVTLCFFIADILLSPWCYRFDREGSTVCYLFFREHLAWNDIEQISIEHSSMGGFLSVLWIFHSSSTMRSMENRKASAAPKGTRSTFARVAAQQP